MKLRRIEVKNFRKIDHVAVEDLKDGLNVIVGDNEAGKSTLLAAMRAAIFEKHRVTGNAADAMRPYSRDVRPEVSLNFELGGTSWSLHKAFCQTQEATLTGGGETITGDAVEERLASLFGFTPPGRGASDPEKHQGAYGLLWVEQGASHRSLGVGAGRETIASALESEVGQVLGGERGRILLGLAEERRNEFWSKAENPKAKGKWKTLKDEVAALGEEISGLEQQFATYDGKIDDLDRRQAVLARHKSERTLERAEQTLQDATRAKGKADSLAQVLREASAHHQVARVERDAALARQGSRSKLAERVETSRLALAAAEGAAAAARETLETLRKVSEGTFARTDQHRSELQMAEAHVTAVETALARRRARQDLTRLEEQLTACESAEAKRREAIAAVQSIAVTEKDLEALDRLQRKVDQARAQLQAASVRIEFRPEGERAIVVGGQDTRGVLTSLLSEDAEIELEGFGQLSVHPGGGVGDLAQKAAEAERAFSDQLRKSQVSDLGQARSEWQRKLKAEQEAENQRGIVRAIAPQGVEALRQSIDSLRAVVEAPISEPAAALTDVTDLTLLEARKLRDAAASAVEIADAEFRQADKVRERAEHEWTTHQERTAAARREDDLAKRELDEARADASDEDLERTLATAEATLKEKERIEAEARAAHDALDPEVVHMRWQQAKEAQETIRKDIEALDLQIRVLKAELNGLGRDGLGERLTECRGQLELKRKQLAVQDQEADASILLHEVLTAAQRESKDRWLGPVRQRVEPYLKMLHPGTDVVLDDESLELHGFIRNGREERFDSLSMGAREQVAVITRLALADILRGSSQPSAVILDDALVNTDQDRLDRMHLVLRKAAENLQVVILTCRERDFLTIGGKLVRMQ